VRSVPELVEMKARGEKIAMLTAYDAPSARIAEAVGVDLLLVGDSLGMVVLGYSTTLPVTLEEMLHHTRAVRRGAPDVFTVMDLPFGWAHRPCPEVLAASVRAIQEGGAHAVKLEGGEEIAETVARLTAAGVPVMGHLGLRPQQVYRLGGYRMQGREEREAEELLRAARALEDAGAFALVLELVPEALARRISQALRIPTIGIGAGRAVDGQVLVWHDLLGIGERRPRFARAYLDLEREIRAAVAAYVADVRSGAFPDREHVPLPEDR